MWKGDTKIQHALTVYHIPAVLLLQHLLTGIRIFITPRPKTIYTDMTMPHTLQAAAPDPRLQSCICCNNKLQKWIYAA